MIPDNRIVSAVIQTKFKRMTTAEELRHSESAQVQARHLVIFDMINFAYSFSAVTFRQLVSVTQR